MKRLIFIISAILIFSVSESFSESSWPFNNCYQDEFANCDSCSVDSTEFDETIIYAGCPIIVSYKVRLCHCPVPTAYIYITYIRINISEPLGCCDLICQLFPPGPFIQNCDPGQQNLNCINNPPDSSAMLALTESLYSMFADTVFSEVSDEYECPNKLTVKYFWPSECVGFCIYEMREVGTSGSLTAHVFVPTSCDGDGCCPTTFTYCKDDQGNIIKTTTAHTGQRECAPYVRPVCLSVGDPFDMNGTLYTITSVISTGCVAPCEDTGE